MFSAEKIVGKINSALQSGATLGKCLLRSRTPFAAPAADRSRPVIIMGNGPSLADLLSRNPRAIRECDLMAVNFAPNANMFFELRPGALVLADPHFFVATKTDAAVERLWQRLRSVCWPLVVYVPAKYSRKVAELLQPEAGLPAPEITVKQFNLTPAEGNQKIMHRLMDKGLAMPRPRNVLIPAIMIALRERYKDIRLVGADHSWSKSLWVDDSNRVVSVQPHFYPDTEKERSRVAKEYEGYHLYHIFNSLAIAFRSYFYIADYAHALGARITNCTPGSFIDAFPRGDIETLSQQ